MELPEEKYVRLLLAREFGATLRKLPREPTRTSDYELLDAGQRMAIAEVKRFVAAAATEANGWVRGDGEVFMSRKDNGPSRILTAIRDKSDQLQRYSETKMLVLVNDDHRMDALDLEEAFNGFLHYGNETLGYIRNTAFSKTAAFARGKTAKQTIDLYVWINRYLGTEVLWRASGAAPAHTEFGPFFRCATPEGNLLVSRYFMDAKNVEQFV